MSRGSVWLRRRPFKAEMTGSSPVRGTVDCAVCKRLKQADCKSAPIRFGGSNPSSTTPSVREAIRLNAHVEVMGVCRRHASLAQLVRARDF